jgi:hypothetical protein
MPTINPFETRITTAGSPGDPQARYRAIQVEAVLALVMGICSLGMFFAWPFIVFPFAALALGYRAIKAIDRTPEEYTGKEMAQAGIVLGVFSLLAGSVTLAIFRSEVPSGYEVIDYSDLEPNAGKVGDMIPEKAYKMSDDKTRVYIKGYILPGRRQAGLKEFSICRTADMCRFGVPSTKKRELIRVKLTGDLTIDYTTEIVGVGGVFHVEPYDPNGMPFSIEADYLYH